MSPRLFPSESRSLELLTSMATVLRETIAATSYLLSADRHERKELLREQEARELKAGDLHYALLTHLRTSFVNPLPREDLYTFSRRLFSATTSMVGAGPLVAESDASQISERVPELLEILGRQTDLTKAALGGLGRLDALEDTWLDLLRLSTRANRTRRAWMLELATAQKIGTVVRQDVLSQDLGQVAQRLHDVTDHLGHVLVKES